MGASLCEFCPTMNPLESDSPLIVYVDIKSPYAFVAIAPTLALETRHGVTFDWRPCTLDIASYAGSARKEEGKVVESSRSSSAWRSIKYSYMDARRYARRQQLDLYGTEKIWDSSMANIGILWVLQQDRQRLASYFNVVYSSFWRRELDIEDVSVVCECIEKAGVSASGFDSFQQGEGRLRHDDLQRRLLASGIYGVPTYVIEGRPFFGREHLPYIDWCLSGRRGQAPDIAYPI